MTDAEDITAPRTPSTKRGAKAKTQQPQEVRDERSTPPAQDQAFTPPAEDPPLTPPAEPKSPTGGSGVPDGTTSPPMDAVQMLSRVRQEDGVHYRLPVTPDDFLIPGSMTPGTEIYVFGLLSPNGESIEFLLRPEKTRERVALSAIATLSPHPMVTLRSYVQKTYTDQSNGVVDLSPADAVVFRLKAYADGVAKVTLNDRILSFRQEADLEMDKCQSFSIVGDVFVASVSIFKPEWPDHMHVTLGNQIAAGYHFTVEGTVSPNADKLVISILRSPDVHDDVLVGIRCQFEGEKQMVRRTKQEGVWLEEQLETQFPFALGEPFTMDVAVLEKEFHMAVNGQALPPYNHKVFYGQGQFICIDKNVTVKNIRVCSISHPKHWTSKPPNVKQASLIFHRNDAPASRQVMLDVGQCYYIQGTPPLHSKTFKITFAKGDTENAEALLVLQPVLAENRVFVYDGSPEQRGNGLHADIRIGRLFSCRIDVGVDSYKVWVNTLVSDDNVDAYEVKHRLPITEALFLNVFGHIKNVSALKAVEELA